MELGNQEEWIRRFRERYLRADRKRKGELLTEFCELIGCHRKHAIRLFRLKSPGRPSTKERRGRKSRYDHPEVISALRTLYRATDRMCSPLLKGAIPSWLPSVEAHYGSLAPETKQLLLTMSASTIERLLKKHHLKFTKPPCGTKPGLMSRTEIPVRQGIWNEKNPGFLEADTVAHCGSSMAGMFIWSLTMTDIATHWTECRATWHKLAKGVVEAVRDIEQALPFELLGFDCDNGFEFLNQYLLAYFRAPGSRRHVIEFTRSREYQKNDNAHVEQRNWSHPRQLFFRERIEFPELVSVMNGIYANEFSLLRNHFYPTMKLEERVLMQSRYRRRYGNAYTPYQRVMQSPAICNELKERLSALHATLDPIALRASLDKKLRQFWSLLAKMKAAKPGSGVSTA